MSSNFTFLPSAFKDLAEASRKAEEQIMSDPCAACFHAIQDRAFGDESLICC